MYYKIELKSMLIENVRWWWLSAIDDVDDKIGRKWFDVFEIQMI